MRPESSPGDREARPSWPTPGASCRPPVPVVAASQGITPAPDDLASSHAPRLLAGMIHPTWSSPAQRDGRGEVRRPVEIPDFARARIEARWARTARAPSFGPVAAGIGPGAIPGPRSQGTPGSPDDRLSFPWPRRVEC